MKNKFLVLCLVGLGTLQASSAQAFDIPLLTWEQGKSQSVVLGGPTAAENWDVSLVSESGLTYPLKASSLNGAGFRVYTIDLADTQAIGRYSITTKGPRSPENKVSEVVVIAAESYEVPKAPYDLLFLMLFLGAFVSLAVSMRRVPTVVASYPNHLADLERLVSGQDLGKNKRFNANFVERMRIKFLVSLPESFLKSVLIADSNFVHRLPGWAGTLMPPATIILGIALFIGNEESGFFSSISSLCLVLLIAISNFDLFSGILGSIAFISMQVLFGGVSDIRMALVAVILVGIFLFPALVNLASMLTTQSMNSLSRATYYLFAIFSVFYIPCSYLLVKSLMVETKLSSQHIPTLIVAALVSLYFKQSFFQKFLNTTDNLSIENVPIQQIPRLFSSGTVLSLFLLLVVLFINWTENFTFSLAAASSWVAPLLLTSIRFENLFQGVFTRVRRVIWLELGLVLFLMFLLFFWARSAPYLVEDLSSLLLVILAIPSVVHAIFVLIVSSSKVQVHQA